METNLFDFIFDFWINLVFFQRSNSNEAKVNNITILTSPIQCTFIKIYCTKYDIFNSIPGVDLGSRPNVTLSSSEIRQQLDAIADFFDLDEAVTIKVGAEKPKSKPVPDPRPDTEQ